MAIYENMPPDGHLTFTERIFTKIKNLFDTKVQTDVPANAVFTDEKVTQTESTANENFEVLVSGTASTATTTEGVNKNKGFKYNPNKHSVMEGQDSKALGQRSHAEGYYTSASNDNSHSEGQGTIASGINSHSEGYYSKATGSGSHAEGNFSYAQGDDSHAEGYYTYTNGTRSHAEGNNTTASGDNSHSEGYKTLASGSDSHAEGSQTTSSGSESHSEGIYSNASGNNSHAEGYYTCATNRYAHAEGECAKAFGEASHAEGSYTYASTSKAHVEGEGSSATNIRAHAEGCYTLAAGANSHSEGYYTTGHGDYSHAEGYSNIANGDATHIEGYQNFSTTSVGSGGHAEGYHTTISSGSGNHSEGYYTYAYGSGGAHAEGGNTRAGSGYSHAEGYGTYVTPAGNAGHAEGMYTTAVYIAHAEGESSYARGDHSHAEGNATYAGNSNSHAEGYHTSAYGYTSHAEGYNTYAQGYTSHVEGFKTTASGDRAHAEGNSVLAQGSYSHAQGQYTTASHKNQFVFGEYNMIDASTATSTDRGNYVEIVGNGLSSTQLSNARTLDWDGNEWVAAGVSVDGLSSTTEGETSTTVQTSFAQLQNKSLTLSDTTDTVTPSETEGEEPTIETETHVIEVTPEDIILDDTWDGSRKSLKETVTFLGSQSAANKVDRSGDTMTGPLVFKGVNDAIQYTGSQATHSMIKFIDNADDIYGNGISIGGGGTTIIGGGESSDAMASSLSTGGSELMYIGNDGDVHIFTNLQNGWDSRKTFTFDTNGSLVFDANIAANVIVPSRSVSYIDGAKGNAGLYAKKAYNVNAWYPAVCLQTKGGGSWQIGNYDNEKLEFAYATKANIDASKNTVSIIHLPENVNGTIYTTGNKPSAADVGALPIGGGTMTGAIGFNNATTRRNTAKNLTSENVTSPGYVVSLTDSWGTFGYSTIAQLKAKFGYGTIVTKNAGDYAAASHSHTYANMEFVGNSPHYIDFHWAGTTADYSARIIESSKGALLVYNSITNSSDRNLKKDIVNLDDNFLNLLNKVKPRQFRWKKGDEFLNLGFIAQEVDEALDEIGVTDKPLVLPGNDDGEIHTDWGLSYNQMIPILWRVCQIQQEKIENLEAVVKAL